MTKNELSKLYYLNLEIKYIQNEIGRLDGASTSATHVITGMPSGNDIDDIVGRSIAEIDNLRDVLKQRVKRHLNQVNKINEFIDSIDDPQIRMIISLRYINCLSWNQVAASIGGGNSEDSVKKVVYRYLNKLNYKN